MDAAKSQRSLDLIQAAHDVLQEIQPASIRAVCYRLFTTGVIDSMSKAETNRVSTQLTWAREQELIPWEWVVDETREAERVPAWKDPAAYVRVVQRAYRRDRWTDQSEWIEVWSEKGTIRGTLAPVLQEYGITFRVMHGYGSATAIKQAALDSLDGDKLLTVFYLGDWDPSGLHMSEVDLPARFNEYGGAFELIRLALCETDLTAALPSFDVDTKGPTATSKGDSRYRWFCRASSGDAVGSSTRSAPWCCARDWSSTSGTAWTWRHGTGPTLSSGRNANRCSAC